MVAYTKLQQLESSSIADHNHWLGFGRQKRGSQKYIRLAIDWCWWLVGLHGEAKHSGCLGSWCIHLFAVLAQAFNLHASAHSNIGACITFDQRDAD